jgi:hypothetical protein
VRMLHLRYARDVAGLNGGHSSIYVCCTFCGHAFECADELWPCLSWVYGFIYVAFLRTNARRGEFLAVFCYQFSALALFYFLYAAVLKHRIIEPQRYHYFSGELHETVKVKQKDQDRSCVCCRNGNCSFGLCCLFQSAKT